MKKLSKKLQSKWSLKKPLYLEKTDKRYSRHIKQLKTNGFTDSETWALDSVIAEFVVPRLIRFKEVNTGFPHGLTPESWDDIIDKIIFALDWSLHCEDDKYDSLSKEEQEENWKKYEEGMQLFAQYFRHLWW